MAYIVYDNLWRREFYDNVFPKGRVGSINYNHLKFKVKDTYQKVEKTTTNFEPSDNEDVVSKAYLDKTLSEVNGHILYLEKNLKSLIFVAANCLRRKS